MALFKIYQGAADELPATYHEGYAYFTTDEGNLYIDISDTERVQVNANSAVYAEAAAMDSGGNLIIDTYALKEYVDQGDTSLKEYYDEPQTVYITRDNKDDYFSSVTDNWHGGEYWDDYLGEQEYAYSEIGASPNIEIVFSQSLTATFFVNAILDTATTGKGVLAVTKNGEVISSEEIELSSSEKRAFTSVSLNVQANDIVKVELTSEEILYDGCTLSIEASFNQKLYYPKDFAKVEEVANVTLSNVTNEALKSRVEEAITFNMQVRKPVFSELFDNVYYYHDEDLEKLFSFKEGDSFIFVPDTTSDSSATETVLQLVTDYWESGFNSISKTIYKYDSSGNLVNPQFIANKPELLMYDGTQFIVVDSLGDSDSGANGLPIVNTFTSSSGSAYVATTDDIDEVVVGTTIVLVPNVTSTTSSPSLALNKIDGTVLLAAAGIRRISSNYNPVNNTAYSGWSSNWLASSRPIVLTYNGTSWIAIDRPKVDVSDVTCNSTALSVSYGGTGYKSISDTTYTTARYRASALVSTETTPTTNGVINWMYE